MERILVILKMASGYRLATFLHERCTANRSRTMFTWWCACPNVLAFIWTVTAFIPSYTCMHLHFRVPIKIPVTLSEHCISHSERFQNTMIELLKTSTDSQISKGVDALKQLFLKRKRIQFLWKDKERLKISTCYNLSGATNENIVQNHLNIALLNVFWY